jgi:hypothetical protein
MPTWSPRPVDGEDGDGKSARSGRRAPKRPELPKLEGLQELAGQDLRGKTIDVTVEGGGTQKIRFLEAGDEPPTKNDLVIVVHSGMSQPDIDGSGVAYGRWSLSKLQDAESGTPQVNIKVARTGATRSLKFPETDWQDSVQIGIATEG